MEIIQTNMSKLIMCRGLPASGKSTWAKEMVQKEDFKRVCKDDLRAMINDSKWSKEKEEQIIESRDLLIIQYLDAGFNVVVDDTNLHPIHAETLAEIADNCDAEFEEKFFNVPLMECIERDSKRGDKSVGAKVIMKMYNQFLKPEAPEYSDEKQNAFIFDIDGTLAIMGDRSPYDVTKIDLDTPNHNITMILRILKATGLPVIILSGRTDDCREETMDWLTNNSIPFDYIGMRDTGDLRKDSVVKEEIYHKFIEPKFNIIGVFDDRDQVVDMWRSLGLTCLQVAYGKF
jgi:predicted kinase